MPLRYSLALMMTASISWNPAAARTKPLGSVMEAKRVHLNSVAVTAGTTVYDGDRFSTEAGGSLRVQNSIAMLDLGEMAVATVRNPANGTKGMEAELDQGTLVFSTASAASLTVIAHEASIRAATDTTTVAHITVTGPKELHIVARRGGLQFSYRGETDALAEGKSYRVILDSPEESPKPGAPTRLRKGFKIVIIGEVVAVVGLGIYELREPESPDRP